MKKALSLILAAAMTAGILSGCTKKDEDSSGAGSSNQTLKVAAIETAYGADMWKEIVAAFEKANPGVKVELTIDKNLEDVISPKMKSGDYPDVVHLAVGRTAALTETMTKDNAIRDLSSMLELTVPGEDVKVKDKIVSGFLDTLVTNPYSDGKTYLAPMFYGPCGLFYDEAFLKSKGWSVPTTWDEMWALGDKAKAEGIALFTYPTTGYFDAFFYALLNETGGPDFFNRAMQYEKGIWDTDEANQAFSIVEKLASYTEKTTVANANDSNYLKNQQLILDHKALFMPNGTWVVGEMKDAPRADGFEWGFTALPAVKEGGDRYSYTFFEQVWSPKQAKNPELADKFMAYLYSDEAAKIFAKAGAIVPLQDVAESGEAINSIANPQALRVLVFPGADGSFVMREDRGTWGATSADTAIAFTWGGADASPSAFTVAPVTGDTSAVPELRDWTVVFRGVAPVDAASGVRAWSGEAPVEATVAYDEATMSLTVSVTGISSAASLRIEIPGGLRIADNPVESDAMDLLLHAQMLYRTKELALQAVHKLGIGAIGALRTMNRGPRYANDFWITDMPDAVAGALEEILLRS